MTREELIEMENELLKRLEFAKSVQSNTKNLEKELTIIRLAKIGTESASAKTIFAART